MATSGRHLARRSAVQALYQWSITGQAAVSILPNFIADHRLTGRHLDYFETLVKEIPLNIEAVDQVILKQISRPIDLVDPTEKAILRVGAYELMYQIDIPTNVVVNEGIEIAKTFCAEQGYKFVNGVLDKIAKQARTGKSTAPTPVVKAAK